MANRYGKKLHFHLILEMGRANMAINFSRLNCKNSDS